MGKIIEVKVGDLKLWLENYRFGKARNEQEALKNLQDTRHFNDLVNSIREHGFQLNNLLTVSQDQQDKSKYLVYDGNRRLAAVKQIPEIRDLSVYEESDKDALNAILAREHSNDPAGRLKWSSVQQARWEDALSRQGLTDNVPDAAKCLRMLESTGETLESNFPLTTFERIYGSSDFSDRFNVSDDWTKVTETEELRGIIEDIKAGKINSRNLNTTENISEYLSRLFDGQPQNERTSLVDDNETDEEVMDEEEANPTRLFRPSEFDIFAGYLENDDMMRELNRASIMRYPHLLSLATRAILDTLRNIAQKDLSMPKALGKNDISTYIKNDNKLKVKLETIVDGLSESAHNLQVKRTAHHINNDRDRVVSLIRAITRHINQ